MTIILGLDLAERTGIGVLSAPDLSLLYSDSVKLANRDTGQGLIRLRDVLQEIIREYHPEHFAIEDVFLPAKTSRKTPISLGELRGVARLCAAEGGIPVFFYAPTKIKLAITGAGRASKEAVVSFIQQEFSVSLKDHNEADAISVAYTHWLNLRFNIAAGINF